VRRGLAIGRCEPTPIEPGTAAAVRGAPLPRLSAVLETGPSSIHTNRPMADCQQSALAEFDSPEPIATAHQLSNAGSDVVAALAARFCLSTYAPKLHGIEPG
jgi:hypothetical protein